MSGSPGPGCPFCDSVDVERVGLWGGQMITAQWRCRGCGSYFEAIRPAFDDPGDARDRYAAERLATPVRPSSERK